MSNADDDAVNGATRATQVLSESAPNLDTDTVGMPSQPDSATGGGGAELSQGLKRVVRRIWKPFRDYPRASVPAILTVVSAAVGLLLLPASKAAVAVKPLIPLIAIQTTPQVPTYLGFIARGPRLGQVVAAFQIPAHQTVTWQIYFQLGQRDHFSWRNGVSATFTPFPPSRVIGGTVPGPIDSYRALRDGYWSFSDGGQGLSFITTNRPIPGLVSLFLRTTGPDRFLATSGYNVSTMLPALVEVPPSPSALFRSEIMVDAAGFENLTGGPAIEKGRWWDWQQNGAVSETSATGIDDLARQAAENRTFEAAVAFGLSGGALAAFAVEGVGAISERRKKVSEKPVPSSGGPGL